MSGTLSKTLVSILTAENFLLRGSVFRNVHQCLREIRKFSAAISERPVQPKLAEEE